MQHRLYGLRGKAYVREYKNLFEKLQEPLKQEFQAIVNNNGKFTPNHLGAIAVKFRLPVKVIDEFLAEICNYPSGTWERLQMKGCQTKDIGVKWH